MSSEIPSVASRGHSPDWRQSLMASLRGPQAASQYPDPAGMARGLDQAYRTRPHLEHLSLRLSAAVQDVERGQSRFLLVSMPPRMGKSMLTSVYFPAWVLASHPTWKLGLLSHSPTLAGGWGRQIRRVIEQNPQLEIGIARDAGAVTDWQTASGGGVVSRSVGQSVTGLGFKVLLLDDIVKDFAAAHSESNRDSVWDWWTFNVRTRLEPPSLVVAIGTRWHEDDILGRLLSPEFEGDPQAWERISFPAVAVEDDILGRKPGDPLLSPLLAETDGEALSRWESIRQGVGAYAWSSLYQQSPAPAKGAIFDVDWFKYYDEQPQFSRVVTSWDCAFKATDSSDFVVGQKWGVDGADRYLIDQVRGRWTFTQTIDRMRSFCSGVNEHLVEDKANGTAVIDVLTREISGMIPINPTDSKQARARAVTPQVEAGNVHLPRAVWVADFVSECRGFPNSAHDDQVDAMTQALSRLRSSQVAAVVSGAWKRKLPV